MQKRPVRETRQRLEERLRRFEHDAAETLGLLETLQAAAPIGIGFVDRDLRIVRLNGMLAAVNGRPLEEQLGRRVADVIPEIWPQLEPVYRSVLEGGEPITNLEVRGRTAEEPERVHHWLSSYYPVNVGSEVIGVGLVVLDITERTEVEAKLMASESRFRLLAERSQDVLYRLRVGQDPGVEYVSPAATTLTGYTPEEIYADPALWQSLVHPDDRGLIPDLTAPGRSRAEIEAPVVMRWVHRDGSIRWTEHRSVPVFDRSGALTAIEGTARDVTARVKADERLRASEARFRAFLSDIEVGALMLNPAGKVQFINDHLLAVLQRTADEVLGQDWINLAVPERERAAVRQAFDEAIVTETGPGHREDGIVNQTGEERRLSWTSVLQQDADGQPAGLAALAVDVTELRRVEAERALLAAAVEQTAEAVIVTDPQGNIVFVNPAFERVTGYARDEVLGRNPRLLQDEGAERSTFAAMWKALRGGQTWQGTLANRRKEGTPYSDSVTITPIFDAVGTLSAYMSVQRDITHLLEVEADLVLEARVRALLGEAIRAEEATWRLEESAESLCEALAALPGIDFALLVAFLEDGSAVTIASRAPAAFPFPPGAQLPTGAARYLQRQAAEGPWGQRLNGGPTSEVGAAARAVGARALAFGPIRHGDHIGGVLVVGTRDPRHVAVVADKMPPLVAFGASSNTLLVERLHARRRDIAREQSVLAVLAARTYDPVFQPIVDLETGDYVGYEALTRFEAGAPPDVRFAEAWSVGLGPELEFATLDAAIADARALPAGRSLHLNISPRLLSERERLHDILRAADRPLVIEITEHEVIPDYGIVREAVRALGHDVRLAVDDAGVGIANFGHIIELRPDLVKLDISLVRRVNTSLGRQALVVAMRHFARAAGCRIVAEGIETEEERRTLQQLGVEFGQGYWLGRPEPAAHWSTDDARAVAG